MILAAPDPTVPGTLLPPVDQDPDKVREAACKILSPADAVCRPTTPRSVDPPHLPAWLGNVVLLLLVLVAVALLVVIVRSIVNSAGGRRPRVGRSGRHRRVPPDEVEESAVAVDRSREPVDWRAEAEAHRRAGRWRDAVRCRYRALVGDLARAGLIDEIPGRTTGEERRQLREVRPRAGVPFDRAADLFDDAWYGDAPVDAGTDDRFQQLEREVLAAGEETR